MKRYGENPYGDSLYRVVFSDSRTDLIGGKWPDGRLEYREVPRYPDLHAWVLEKWQSPEEYAGTREEYERQQLDLESGLFTCGPYPNRGEYAFVYAFPCAPGDGMVSKIVTAIKLSRSITTGQQKQAIMGAYEQQEKDRFNRFDAIWDDAMGFRQQADAVVSFGPNWGRQGFKRGSDMPADKLASAPLPTGDNYFGAMSKTIAEEIHANSNT